jgi:peroxiredoxin
MAVQVGDKVPSTTLQHMTDGGPADISSDEVFAGKKVVLFALPGAFTPTCSAKHLPGFVQQAAAIKAKGVDTIACLSVNDAFVMGAWGKDQGVGDTVLMLADGSADFTKAMGLELDLDSRGFGLRSQRYAMIVDDGVVTALNVEDGGAFQVPYLSSEPRCCSRAARARASARSFSGWPSCPLTQCQFTSWGLSAASSRCQRSTFFTGFFAAVFQPRRFQSWIQRVMPSRR